ncbi:MAG: S41 family peptidase [Flavobacteriales bacterium]|nr:S41 family peptidase [Flavobacteriales bacterium]
MKQLLYLLKSKVTLWTGALLLLTVTLSTTLADDYFEISKNLEIFTSVYKELNTYYVDETKPGSLMKAGIDAMLRSLDPYTVYYPESKIEDYKFMTTGQYGGIGALVNTIDGKITIVEPQEGFAAARAGLKSGDVVLEVDGKPVQGKSADELSEFLTGQPGTEVVLKVSRVGENEPLTFTVKREEIKVPDVPHYEMLDDHTGYIQLMGFTRTASSDVRSAFTALKARGMHQLILDLRGNGGGLLAEAVNIVNFFVPKGTEITRTKGKLEEWNKTYYALNDPLDTQIPLAVLIDDMSASASEIVSGSLQDLDRAVIVGSESYGKGLVQQTKDMAYNTKLKLTIAKYYIPSGRCIQRLDYSHRNEQTGEVSAVSDSLIKPFSTRNGRKVYDGRGIAPDLPVEGEETSHILTALVENWIIFEYANQYYHAHSSIDSADVFHLTDAEYNEFVNYAESNDFSYDTHTEEIFHELKKTAEQENYYKGSEREFDQLFARIAPNKKDDLIKFKTQILEVLESEIVSRYYLQTGRIRHNLPSDPVVQKAREVFAFGYIDILSPPAGKK